MQRIQNHFGKAIRKGLRSLQKILPLSDYPCQGKMRGGSIAPGATQSSSAIPRQRPSTRAWSRANTAPKASVCPPRRGRDTRNLHRCFRRFVGRNRKSRSPFLGSRTPSRERDVRCLHPAQRDRRAQELSRSSAQCRGQGRRQLSETDLISTGYQKSCKRH